MSNSTLYIIVDDADPAITYSPGWRTSIPQNAASIYYKGTTHGTQSFYTPDIVSTLNLVSLSYTFHGTEVLVGGSISSANGEAPVQCSVDGVLQKLSVSNLAFCHVTNLSDDVHQFNLSFVHSAAQSAIVVDYLLYVPSQNSSSQPPNQISDVSRDIFLTPNNQGIKLEGWSPMDSEGLAGMQTNGTDATLSLNFTGASPVILVNSCYLFSQNILTGSSVTWFNCIEKPMSPSTRIIYTIDSDSKDASLDDLSKAILFNKSLPNSGNHQLELTYHNAPEPQNTLTLCGLVIENRSVSAAPPSTSTMVPPTSSTNRSSTVDAAKTHSQTAAIVGSVVGGIILIFLVVLGFLLCRLWRKRRRMVNEILHTEFAIVNGNGNKPTTGPRDSQITISSIRKSIVAPGIPNRSSIAKSLLSTFTAFRPSPQTAQVGSDYGCSTPNSPWDTRQSYTSKVSGQAYH